MFLRYRLETVAPDVAVAPDCTLPASASSESSRSLGGDGRRAWSPFLRFLIGDHVVVGVVVNVVVVDDGGLLVPLLLVAWDDVCMYVLYVVITVRLFWVSRLLPRSSP